VERMRKTKNANRILAKKANGKHPVERLKRRWKISNRNRGGYNKLGIMSNGRLLYHQSLAFNSAITMVVSYGKELWLF
jgi:hypothetical protein